MKDYQITLEPHPRNARARVRVLAGTDDAVPFRVVVPLRITSVEAAVEWLRPAGVPADALRQGEFYFLPSDGPHVEAGCDHPAGRPTNRADCGHGEYTDAGSHYRYNVTWGASFSRTHTAADCKAVVKSGSVRFPGRRTTKSHDFVSRPRYFARGSVQHDEHGTLELPCHNPLYQDDPQHRGDWYEVVPNRAHGPFPVEGFGPAD